VLSPATSVETLRLLESIEELSDVRVLVRALTTIDAETSTALPA
jgi:hypothetical protein